MHGTARCVTLRHGTSRHGRVRYGTWHDMTRPCLALKRQGVITNYGRTAVQMVCHSICTASTWPPLHTYTFVHIHIYYYIILIISVSPLRQDIIRSKFTSCFKLLEGCKRIKGIEEDSPATLYQLRSVLWISAAMHGERVLRFLLPGIVYMSGFVIGFCVQFILTDNNLSSI